MRRIAKKVGESNCVTLVRGGLGYVVKGQSGVWHGKRPPKREQGDITTFSRSAQRRLREILAMGKLASGEMAHLYGATLTIPGEELKPEVARFIWGAFVDGMKRRFNDVPMVWRIEQQTRKDRRQAHWHCVLWIGGEEMAARVKAVEISLLWQRVVLDRVGALKRKTLTGFYRHGTALQCLDGSSATGLIGYLCDHASKHKQEQLGWIGRQWGVINRARLDLCGDIVLEVDRDAHKRAARQYRRLQEHLRRQGVYTGVRVNPAANVSKAIFGKDAERLIRCYSLPS